MVASLYEQTSLIIEFTLRRLELFKTHTLKCDVEMNYTYSPTNCILLSEYNICFIYSYL
jgi:hypothetical protein